MYVRQGGELMYFKNIRVQKQDQVPEIGDIIRFMEESPYFKNVEKKEDRLSGVDMADKPFIIKYNDYSIIYIELDIEATSSDSIVLLTNLMKEKGLKFEESQVEDQFSLLRGIKSDIHTIKNIMVFYLILTILGFILSFMR